MLRKILNYIKDNILLSPRRHTFKIGFLSILVAMLAIALMLTRPISSDKVEIISIKEGEAIGIVSQELKERNIVRSSKIFKALMKYGHQEKMVAGDYLIEEPENVLEIARRLKEGDFRLDLVDVTIPEGSTNSQIADTFAKKLPKFNSKQFLEISSSSTGYLFPDTYKFSPLATQNEVYSKLLSTFDEKTRDLKKEAHTRTWEDIVIMASILEKEASDEKTRKKIADVLWRRLDGGMRLQVDAPFLVMYGKESSEVTQEDLFDNSPYNTYRNDGLPPGPITNPGLESIRDAMYPTKNDYVYYLADSEGKTYFSVTFEEHKEKKLKYLN